MKRWWALTVFALAMAPSLTLAEGAALEVACEATRVCDADGDCVASTEQVVFRLEPIKIGPEGVGTYTINYGEIFVRAKKVAPLGPFLWREAGNDLQSLVRDGPSPGMLWHRFTPDDPPGSQVIFLTCEAIG